MYYVYSECPNTGERKYDIDTNGERKVYTTNSMSIRLITSPLKLKADRVL